MLIKGKLNLQNIVRIIIVKNRKVNKIFNIPQFHIRSNINTSSKKKPVNHWLLYFICSLKIISNTNLLPPALASY